MLNPGSVFASPEALLANKALSSREKIELLRRWEYDASASGVAVEEGMSGDESDLLRRILLALERLAEIDAEKIGPTKQHGLPRSAVKPK